MSDKRRISSSAVDGCSCSGASEWQPREDSISSRVRFGPVGGTNLPALLPVVEFTRAHALSFYRRFLYSLLFHYCRCCRHCRRRRLRLFNLVNQPVRWCWWHYFWQPERQSSPQRTTTITDRLIESSSSQFPATAATAASVADNSRPCPSSRATQPRGTGGATPPAGSRGREASYSSQSGHNSAAAAATTHGGPG